MRKCIVSRVWSRDRRLALQIAIEEANSQIAIEKDIRDLREVEAVVKHLVEQVVAEVGFDEL